MARNDSFRINPSSRNQYTSNKRRHSHSSPASNSGSAKDSMFANTHSRGRAAMPYRPMQMLPMCEDTQARSRKRDRIALAACGSNSGTRSKCPHRPVPKTLTRAIASFKKQLSERGSENDSRNASVFIFMAQIVYIRSGADSPSRARMFRRTVWVAWTRTRRAFMVSGSSQTTRRAGVRLPAS